MKSRGILVSGASIAGPAVAYWLRRYGFNPMIVERAPAPRSGGQAIDLRGVARTVVERMGIMEEIRQAHSGTHGMSVVNRAGKRLSSMDSETMNGSGGLIAEIEILRGELVRILYAATRDEVEYIFDDSITSLAQREDGVSVTFERSAPRVFDFVIGADGLHSNVRSLAFDDESQATHDMGCYVAIFSAPNEYHLDGWELIYQMPGSRHLAGKSVGIYPTHGNRQVNAAFYFAAPQLNIERHDILAQKQLLARTFDGEAWKIPQLLDAMWDAPDFYFDRIAQTRLKQWSHGRVALLGDAAYCPSPLSGMGTSLALVGAYVLAGELAATTDEYAGAFARYQNTMGEAVMRAQRFAESAPGFLLPKSRFQIWSINTAMRDGALAAQPIDVEWRGESGKRRHPERLSVPDCPDCSGGCIFQVGLSRSQRRHPLRCWQHFGVPVS